MTTPTTPKPIVGYIRVSTKKQGDSGLGLEGQVHALTTYAAQTGGTILKQYREVETGKDNDRPELAKALKYAKRMNAELVVAKLDRLSRNVAFIAAVMDSGVEFKACDNPTANRLTLHILAAVAEQEAKAISERTKAGLAAFKANKHVSKAMKIRYPDGVPPEIVEATAGKLGAELPQCRNLDQEARKKGAVNSAAKRRDEAKEENKEEAAIIVACRNEGLSYRAIAKKLNDDGHVSRTGKAWNQVQVMLIFKRLGST